MHFLLYIADMLRAELGVTGPDALEEASRRSQVMTLNLYSKPPSQVQQ